MTIKCLWDQCIPGIKYKALFKFDVASGQSIAIDFNYWLHGLCSTQTNALLITCHLPCPPKDVVKTIESWHKSMTKNNITPYYAIEGRKHPMKSETHSDRLEKRSKAKIALAFFYDRGKIDPNELTAEDYKRGNEMHKKHFHS